MSDNPYAAPKSSVKSPSGLAGGVYVEGDLLVCPPNAILPKRCVKTNTDLEGKNSSHGKRFKKAMYFCPPWVLLTFLIAGLLTLILYMVLRKKLDISYSLSYEALSKYTGKRNILLVLIGACVIGLFTITGEGIIVGLVFAIIFLLILLTFTANHLSIKKFDNGKFYIKGCHQDFLDYITERNERKDAI
ncbi:MAG: hypothetical protein NE330_11925 [Lentisphaeraceae bacterium]|nr:hypothetical protein [Lentisphaeraceae bacterium]